jgi:hypothetical protein
MGQTADQIRDEIDTQRMELGDNLQQLERKVKETVDWRAQFEQKPMLGLGMAFGAGELLSALLPSGDDKRSASQSTTAGNYAYTPYASYTGAGSQSGDGQRRETPQPSSYMASSQPPKQRSPEMNEITETLDNIKGALLGLGATRLRSFLAEAVPGFHQEYEQARKSRNNSPQTRLETAEATISDDARERAASYDMSNSAPRSSGTHETQSTYHPDLNAQTPGLDQRTRDAAAVRPSAEAFGSSQTTSNPPR